MSAIKQTVKKSDFFVRNIEPYLVQANVVAALPLTLVVLTHSITGMLMYVTGFFVCSWWLKQKRLGKTRRDQFQI